MTHRFSAWPSRSSPPALDILELSYSDAMSDPPADPLADPPWNQLDFHTCAPRWEALPPETFTAAPSVDAQPSASKRTSATSSSRGTTSAAHESSRTHYPTVSRQRPKQYKHASASKFCHVCGRKAHNVQVMVCCRLKKGLCRKVVCKFCFEKYAWDMQVFHDVSKQQQWTCPHCKGQCVPKAQCVTYGRTNFKRHLMLRRRRFDKQSTKSSSSRSTD